MKIYTNRYKDYDPTQGTAVRITYGRPRFHTPYTLYQARLIGQEEKQGNLQPHVLFAVASAEEKAGDTGRLAEKGGKAPWTLNRRCA